MSASAGEYAFPVVQGCGSDKGMTLRDYFAAKALPWVCDDLPACENFYQRAAVKAYQLADAMLAARETD